MRALKKETEKAPQPKLKLMINSLSFFDEEGEVESDQKKTNLEDLSNWENDGGSNFKQIISKKKINKN